MSNKTYIKLLNFYIFNPSFYNNEGDEEKKILYYYPPKTELDVQLKNAGLSEALIKFTLSFDSDEPCQSFYTEKTKQFFYQPEKNFWMVMTVTVPSVSKQIDNSAIDEQIYLHDEVEDNKFNSILILTYKTFRLFNGKFMRILDSCEDPVEELKSQFNLFYDEYLTNLKLSHCDILDVFQGISYLPLGKDPFLHVQCFINHVEMTFTSIKYSIFLYNDQLVWSGIGPEDMQVIYQYLINTLLPAYLDLELQGGSLPNSTSHHYGSFVTGPHNSLETIVNTNKVPKVYLDNDSEDCRAYHLVVYRSLSSSLCLLFDINNQLSMSLFRELDTFLGPKLTTLVSEVSEHYCQSHSTSSTTADNLQLKFVYFNKLNLAYKSTIHAGGKKHGNVNVPADVMRIMTDVNNTKSGCVSCEVMIKTSNDCWLVCKNSNGREFYVVITQKKSSLIDVSEEVKKLCDTELKGIFFME